MKLQSFRSSQGFALLITIALVTFLVVVVVGAVALARLSAQMNSTSVLQMQARQNALLGFSIALGELQNSAGLDSAVTGIAGITGFSRTQHGATGAMSSLRNWTGVWNADGTFNRWLSSSSNSRSAAPIFPSDPLTLVGVKSAGNGTSANAENQHVQVERLPIMEFRNGESSFRTGSFAYWVGDEGVKLSAYIPNASAVISGLLHSTNEVITDLSPTATNLDRVLTFNQLAYFGSGANLMGPATLADGFHQITVTHFLVTDSGLRAGALNINSTSSTYWEGIAGTFNRLNTGKTISNTTTFARRVRDNFLEAAGKNNAGPFLSVSSFGGSNLLSTALGTAISPEEFMGALGGALATRSDTFRIRAYGDALSIEGSVVSRAYCEAIVQRTLDNAADGFGRRFRVVRFRWLGPDDI